MKLAQGLRNSWKEFALFTGFLTFYLSTATSYFTYDAISYALSIRYAEISGSLIPLFHPHHLLFNAIGASALDVLRIFNPSMEQLDALQVMNAVTAAAGLVIIYRFVHTFVLDLTKSGDTFRMELLSFSITAACGFSFGYWIAATDGRANMLGVVATIAAAYTSYRLSMKPALKLAVVLGVLVGIAALLHQSHGLFIVVALCAIAFTQTNLSMKLKMVGLFLGVFFVTFTLPYLVVARIRGISSLSSMIWWATTYAHTGIWWSFDLPRNIFLDMAALVHAYIPDPQTISKDYAYAVFEWGFILAPVAIATALLMRVFTGIREGSYQIALEGVKGGGYDQENVTRVNGNALGSFNIVMITWALVYAVFFTFWCPGYFVFWIPVAIAGIMLVAANALAFTGRSVWVTAFFLLWTLALFSLNSVGYVVPRSKPENNRYLMLAKAVEQNTKKGDIVILTGMGYLAEAEVYIPYFAKRNVISIQQIMREHGGFAPGAIDWMSRKVDRKLNADKGVYILEEAIAPGHAWEQMEARYSLDRKDVQQMLSKYKLKPAFEWKHQVIYRLERSNR